MAAPLKGIKVVELARILAGPWAGQLLGDLGAEVIKVESEQGDDTRAWGPPFIERDNDVSAAYFHGCNRGKKSITVDLSTSKGQERIKKLVKESDILIENFKVGGLKKYGLDYESLKTNNKALIYCSITGFGQDGPYATRAGYDYIIQGMSGLMSITGEPGGPPLKTGVAVTDIFTGIYASTAILAALHQRKETGLGQHIDMSLLDSAVAILANQGMNYLSTGNSPGRMGNFHPNLSPYQVFECSDGHIIIATGNDQQYQRFCDILQCPELGKNPKFVSNAKRVENRHELDEVLSRKTRNWKKAKLLKRCEVTSIPAGPINSLDEVFSDKQIIHRGMKLSLDGIPSIRSPIRFSESELNLDKPSPKLGEHNSVIFPDN
ncbi:MAG: CaiB/BaiF CoA transferase family protein [Paracoccaceae bacterium]|jgi:crotonobetainyl-CoA:carnitine CoA-transferase CaiB-like acyl-CoA transferase|nr:CaiB/BaiF CoA-transferase family protein [Paracoccaceae bacterium]MDG1155015.1 CaiB/BaiF CoA-transferase family protein [Paracoccaceae bacterium]MDG2430095.1 CaiB/BaiF CoA-transferase family protein [Paracoccaceae bacterium]|tara:strand:+ start:554 stop:1687 length:1134 start_codon:yes stop_codon:yes gene_type:complete